MRDVPGAAPNPSNPQTATSGTPVELIVPWASANIPAEYATRKHQCMFVQLTADSGVNFVSSSERRNMDFIPLSEEERPADISGEGYPAPGAGPLSTHTTDRPLRPSSNATAAPITPAPITTASALLRGMPP